MDHLRFAFGSEVEADATHEAGVGIAFGWVAHEAGWLVEDHQRQIFVEHLDERNHVVGGVCAHGVWCVEKRRACLRNVSLYPGALVQAPASRWLPWVVAVAFMVTRIPGVMPPNFSAVYALMFCAGVFFPTHLRWSIPFGVMMVTDLGLNLYYQFVKGIDVFSLGIVIYLAANYVGYAGLVILGRRFKPTSHFLGLLAGGLLGAVLFYLITNSVSWLLNPFHNPEYTRDLKGWIIALTRGVGGWPQTWEFFRNTLLGSGIFTALFAGAWKLTVAESPAEKGEEDHKGEPQSAAEPEEAKA